MRRLADRFGYAGLPAGLTRYLLAVSVAGPVLLRAVPGPRTPGSGESGTFEANDTQPIQNAMRHKPRRAVVP